MRAEQRPLRMAVGDEPPQPHESGRRRCEPSEARGWPWAMRAERRTRMAVGVASRECLAGWSHFAAVDDLRGWCRMAGALESLMGHVETRRDRSVGRMCGAAGGIERADRRDDARGCGQRAALRWRAE